MLIRSLIAFLTLPAIAIFAIPVAIFLAGNCNTSGVVPSITGVALVVAGMFMMWHTISLFFSVGNGTLAPWDPPRSLVVRGIYRHVRNPMISGVCCVLLGESLLFASTYMALWFALFALANLIYLPLVEEPKLKKRFGEDYEQYKRNVPRWFPRRSPWSQAG